VEQFVDIVVRELPEVQPLRHDLEAAVASLGDIALDARRFAAYLRERLGDGQGLHVADLYLACACLESVPAALQRMQREHLQSVPEMLRSYPNLVADEVAELLPERLFVAADGKPPKLAQYSGRARLRTWLKTVVLNLARDVQRKRRVVVPLEDNIGLCDAIGLDIEREQGRQASAVDFRQALAQAIAKLAPEQRLLLHGMYVEGLTLKELGAPEGTDPSTTFYRLKKVYATLRQEIEADLQSRLRLSPSACESLVRSMLSHMDLRITGLFGRK
jgi:RNA polymerase sigma-70 factor